MTKGSNLYLKPFGGTSITGITVAPTKTLALIFSLKDAKITKSKSSDIGKRKTKMGSLLIPSISRHRFHYTADVIRGFCQGKNETLRYHGVTNDRRYSHCRELYCIYSE